MVFCKLFVNFGEELKCLRRSKKKFFICVYIGVEELFVIVFFVVFMFDSFLFVDIDWGSSFRN